MKKTVCLLVLAALSGQPALANEHTPPATDQRTVVLGQPENQPGNGASANTAPSSGGATKKDAQALFEESLRQMMPLDQGQIQEYRPRRPPGLSTLSAPSSNWRSAPISSLTSMRRA